MFGKFISWYSPWFDFKRFMLQSTLYFIGLGVVLTLNVEKHFISLNWLLLATAVFAGLAIFFRPLQTWFINWSKGKLLEKLKPFLKNPQNAEGNEVLETTDKIFTLYKEILVSIVAVFTLVILYAINYNDELASIKTIHIQGKVGGMGVENGNIVKLNVPNAKVHVQFVGDTDDLLTCDSIGNFSKDIEVKSKVKYVIFNAYSDNNFSKDMVDKEIPPSNKLDYSPVLQKED